jgi:hypothetical protein
MGTAVLTVAGVTARTAQDAFGIAAPGSTALRPAMRRIADMVARTRPEPDALAVVFERDGEKPVRIDAANGEKACIRALTILLAKSKLQLGDRLTVEAAD